MTTRRARSPRFAEPAIRPNIQITPDDVQILWYVYRHRLIDAEMLRRLIPYRSRQGLTRRFNLLRKAGYLQRIGQPREWKETPDGSTPLAYALANEGARKLEAEGLTIDTVRWRERNKLTNQSIKHTLETTEAVVQFELASRNAGHVDVVYFDQIMGMAAQGREQRRSVSTVLEAPVEWRGARQFAGTDPDKLFGLRNHRKESDRQFSYYCLELDRGTETILPSEQKLASPRFFQTTSFLKKMLIYATAYREKAHVSAYGIPNFRVLTVTTSQDRIETMQDAYRRHVSNIMPGGLFLFTTLEALRASPSAAFEGWRDAGNKDCSLV